MTSTEHERPWWRDRADEIERQVGMGKMNAMACYTQMVQLLDAARRAPVVAQGPAFESQAFGLHGPTGPITQFFAAAPQPPDAGKSNSVEFGGIKTEAAPAQLPAMWAQFAELFAAQCESRSRSLCKDGSHSAANEASKCATTIRMPNEYWRAKLIELQVQLIAANGTK